MTKRTTRTPPITVSGTSPDPLGLPARDVVLTNGARHAVDQEVVEAIKVASHFTVSIFLGRDKGGNETHPLKTLALARIAARILPKVRGSHRKALVYVVTTDGRALMVPDYLEIEA